MNGWYEQAKDKLEKEAKEIKGFRRDALMAAAVKDTLLSFCGQEEELAQAVAQGGSFHECMAAVAKGVGNSISDLDAYKRAVSFYFPGAAVSMIMRIDLCGSVRAEGPEEDNVLRLNFDDFL